MAKVWRELTGGDASAQGNDSETHDDVDVGKGPESSRLEGKAQATSLAPAPAAEFSPLSRRIPNRVRT